MKKIVLAFSLLLFLFACNSRGYYDETIHIPEQGWFKDDAAVFAVDIQDSLASYDLYLNVRNTNDYKWMQIYFFIQTQFPDHHYSRDTIEVALADHRGKWLGNGIGNIKDNNVLLRKQMRFPQKGSYRFEVFHGMRTDTLKGIHDIGIRIEESELAF